VFVVACARSLGSISPNCSVLSSAGTVWRHSDVRTRAPISPELLLTILKCFLVANNSLPLLPTSVCTSIHLDGGRPCGASAFCFLRVRQQFFCFPRASRLDMRARADARSQLDCGAHRLIAARNSRRACPHVQIVATCRPSLCGPFRPLTHDRAAFRTSVLRTELPPARICLGRQSLRADPNLRRRRRPAV
jgi:hypothetical protein